MKKGKKQTTYIEATMKPDFSKYIKDGKFDALDALENHYHYASLFLQGAMAMIGEEDSGAAPSAYVMLETFQLAMSRGISEAYRLRESTKTVKAA